MRNVDGKVIGGLLVMTISLTALSGDIGNGEEGNIVSNMMLNDEWNRTFGGSAEDWAFFVQQTADEGYIIVGLTQSFGAGSDDVWLIKTDADGNKVWDKTFGGNRGDRGYSVRQTSDGGYIVTGYTMSFGDGGNDVWLIKTDNSGSHIWNKTFGGSSVDWGYSVQGTSDGGYIVAGYTESFGAGKYDVWLIKTDADGNRLWDRTFGGSNDDVCYAVQETSDGSYIIVGSTASLGIGDSDMWLIKTDADGNKVWDKTFGGIRLEEGYSIQQTRDGGYVLTGLTDSFSVGDYDLWLIKTDANGNKIWDELIGGDEWDVGFSAQQTYDDGFIITGFTDSYSKGMSDIWLVKTNSLGEVEWYKTFGGAYRDRGFSVLQNKKGDYIIAGLTMSFGAGGRDVWLIKVTGFKNQSPNTPTITGPTTGKVGIEYEYTFVATDPDGDDVYYWVQWGEGCPTVEWIGPYASGEEVTLTYSWDTQGTYTIQVKAKDVYGFESDWGTLKVSMPKPYQSYTEFLSEMLNHWFISVFGRELFPAFFIL